jgi:hypothetical protein
VTDEDKMLVVLTPEQAAQLSGKDGERVVVDGKVMTIVAQGQVPIPQPPYNDVRQVLYDLPNHTNGGNSYAWTDLFTVRAEILKSMRPQPYSVFEFGALTGYFPVCAVHTCPTIKRVGWVDNEAHTEGSNKMCAENLSSVRSGLRLRWWHSREAFQATYDAGGVDPYDVVSVDSGHTYQDCLDDLRCASWLQPRLIMVDDWTGQVHRDDIQGAVKNFLVEQPYWRLTEHETVNGLACLWRET